MTATFKELEEQAQTLAAEDRAKFAETLLDSLQMPVGEIQTAWAEEIEERVAAFDAGETKTFGAEDVFAEARREFSRRGRLLLPITVGAWDALRCFS